MQGQKGFWDFEQRLEELSREGDPRDAFRRSVRGEPDGHSLRRHDLHAMKTVSGRERRRSVIKHGHRNESRPWIVRQGQSALPRPPPPFAQMIG